MKKSEITGIIALLVLATIAAACVQAPGPAPGPGGDTVIRYKLYGGFVMPSYAIQELVVTPYQATFTIGSADGNITEQYRKNLTKEQFDSIVTVFYENNFSGFQDRYDEGQSHVADVGWTDISLTQNNKTKTVTTYNFDGTLPAGLVQIREKLRETIEFTKMLDESQLKTLAERWIRDAPTFRFDGSDLTFVRNMQLESDPVRHVLTYRFTSSHAGYGNRSGAVTAQVITNHTITLVIVDGIVQSAVIDGKWDEMGQFVIGSELSLSFQPVKCEKPSWQIWEENSGRVYIRAPTDEEIIRHYYAAVYQIDVRDVKKTGTGLLTCDACSVCQESYHYTLTVNASEAQPLLEEGWVRV